MEKFAYMIMPTIQLENGWKVWAEVDSDGHLTVEVMNDNDSNDNIFDTETTTEGNMYRFSTHRIETEFQKEND